MRTNQANVCVGAAVSRDLGASVKSGDFKLNRCFRVAKSRSTAPPAVRRVASMRLGGSRAIQQSG